MRVDNRGVQAINGQLVVAALAGQQSEQRGVRQQRRQHQRERQQRRQ